MMKKLAMSDKKTSFFILLTLLVLEVACQDDGSHDEWTDGSAVEFSVSISKAMAFDRLDAVDALLITIEDATGAEVYSDARVEFIWSDDGAFVSKPVLLAPGDYRLTRFLVVDDADDEMYTTPARASADAHLVERPLPISFSISEGALSSVQPEVREQHEEEPGDDPVAKCVQGPGSCGCYVGPGECTTYYPTNEFDGTVLECLDGKIRYMKRVYHADIYQNGNRRGAFKTLMLGPCSYFPPPSTCDTCGW